MVEMLNRFWKEEEGQDLVEYALIVALIAVALIATFSNVKNGIQGAFSKVISALQ